MTNTLVNESSQGWYPCECGKHTTVNTSETLMSSPPLFKTHCNQCGIDAYIPTLTYHTYHYRLKQEAETAELEAHKKKIEELTHRVEEVEKIINRMRIDAGKEWDHG